MNVVTQISALNIAKNIASILQLVSINKIIFIKPTQMYIHIRIIN